MTFKLLIVEDNADDLGTLMDTIDRYKDQHSREIDVVSCETTAEASEAIDNSFDGAIIDMKLGQNATGGNDVMRGIVDQNIRIPIAVVTGTPAAVDKSIGHFDVHTKGSIEYTDLIDQFWGVHNSGLTRVMGARGKIEVLLNEVYHKNILPQKDAWIANGESDAEKSEGALLRHTLNHLIHIIDQDNEDCFAEEFYISPPANTEWRTGAIHSVKDNGEFFTVISPACDLANRGQRDIKTCHIQVLMIETIETAVGDRVDGNARGYIKKLKKNTAGEFYHYLPKTDFFEGGVLNFRRVHSIPKDNFESVYGAALHQISVPFLKDIVSRFASYYARQGQPGISES